MANDTPTGVLDVLRKFVDDELRAEGITPELLDMVMLEVEYSPVLPFAGGQFGRDDVKVRPWGFSGADDELPERFEVLHPMVNNPVSRESLKVMRLRWLLARGKYYEPQMNALCERLKEQP